MKIQLIKLKKEVIKESGKFILDIAKIIIAITIITPFAKGGNIEILPLVVATATAGVGIYVINKGTKDE